MSLAAGTRLGPYEVLGLIGAGGMGEVYKARDTRLGRIVAVKVLPTELADPEHRARFEREARSIAGLTHPHICTLHDCGEQLPASGSAQALLYLVMEHLEGQTLAERLQKGPMPIDEALAVAAEIADALAAAHRHGIVHRDLKPANVMLTKAGAKLLDFGLAKLTGHGEQPAVYMAASPRAGSTSLTSAGVILGTLQYMAPEQIEGKPADGRTDLWALATITYEMLTGQRPFEGTSAASVVAAILEREPAPLATLQPLTPAPLDRLVRQCLSKSPGERPDTAHDVALELAWLRAWADPATRPSRPPVAPRRWPIAVALPAALILGAVVGGGVWRSLRPPAPPDQPLYVTIPLDTEPVETGGQYAHIAVSPDGRSVVFKDTGMLVTRRLSADAIVKIAGTDNAMFPAFRPDGGVIAFGLPSGGIKRVATGGGPVTEVTNAAVSAGIAWGDDDRIYFSAGAGTQGIWRVPAVGGRPEAVSHVDDAAGETAHTWPQLLPGARALLFTALGPSGGADDSRIVLQRLGSAEKQVVAERAIFGRYVESGHLIFARNDGTVYASAFDSDTLRPAGEPTPVLTKVGTATWGGAAFLAVSRGGTLAFVRPTTNPYRLFRIVDAAGDPVSPGRCALDPAAMARVGAHAHTVEVAPDGRRCVVTGRSSGVADIWLLDVSSGEAERVTFDPAEDEFAAWSPDSTSIAYASAQAGSARRILTKTLDRGTAPRLVRTWPRHIHVTSWSPDGRWLAAHDYSATSSSDVWAIRIDGEETAAVAASGAAEHGARFSPDGRWLAYASDESGRSEVYVASFPGLGSKHQLSADGGMLPRWDPDGRALYYLQQGFLVRHEVRAGETFTKGKASKMFPTEAQEFAVARDRTFILGEPNRRSSGAPLHLVLNWFTELVGKVPPR